VSLLVNLGFAVQDAGSGGGPRAGSPACSPGGRFYLHPTYSAQLCCNIGQGSPLRRGTAVADPDHSRQVGIWRLCSCSCKRGEVKKLVSLSKAASRKVANDFLLQGQQPPLLLAMAGPSLSGRGSCFHTDHT